MNKVVCSCDTDLCNGHFETLAVSAYLKKIIYLYATTEASANISLSETLQ